MSESPNPSLPLVQIVSPAYNEEPVLHLLIEALDKVFEDLKSKYRFEVILVIERSKDKTFEVAKSLATKDSRIKIIHFSRQFGHQIALKAGIDHADADVVVMMDSDLQHPPAVIKEMLEQYEGGNNIVFTQKNADHRNRFTRLCSLMFYTMINKISRTYIIPYSSDFRLIDRKVLKEFQANIHEWDPFLRGIFSWMGYRSTIVNYDVAARAAGESKYGLRLLSHLAIAGTTSFSTFPLEVGIYIGIITLIASVLLFVTLFGMFLTQNEIHWSLFNANLIVFFGSIQICLLGMIGEYVGRIFLEQKQRPLYIVDETIGF